MRFQIDTIHHGIVWCPLLRYDTVRYLYGTVRYRSQISFALIGLLAARANHHFYRFRTVFRVQNGMVTLHGSCVRLNSPSDLACLRACVRVCMRVSGYRDLFLYASTRIHNNPPNFFQNTNTGSVLLILIRYKTVICRDNVAILSRYPTGTVR